MDGDEVSILLIPGWDEEMNDLIWMICCEVIGMKIIKEGAKKTSFEIDVTKFLKLVTVFGKLFCSWSPVIFKCKERGHCTFECNWLWLVTKLHLIAFYFNVKCGVKDIHGN